MSESFIDMKIDNSAVLRAYHRWAPVYDFTFGQVARAGRLNAVKIINSRKGKVLEAGVGTGLSLPTYGDHLKVTGIDLSPEMLDKAKLRVIDKDLENIDHLREMDAGDLDFGDEHFDTVVAMYVLTVVPEPEKVMGELHRVCKTGGEVILVNHFSTDEGLRGWMEEKLAPLADKLGWRPEFPVERVMGCKGLRLAERRALNPFGLFTMLRFVKQPEFASNTAIKPGRVATGATFQPVEAGG